MKEIRKSCGKEKVKIYWRKEKERKEIKEREGEKGDRWVSDRRGEERERKGEYAIGKLGEHKESEEKGRREKKQMRGEAGTGD